jgi:hypothetical protein
VAFKETDVLSLRTSVFLMRGAHAEYIPDASACPTEDKSNRILPVLHFTPQSVGYVTCQGQYFS